MKTTPRELKDGEPGGPSVPPKWTWHYRVLAALRDRLEAERQARRGELNDPIEAHGAHPADSGSDEFDHELALTLLAHEEDALAQVTEALERIRNGTYGLCLATGQRIPAQRLRVLPWCRYSREIEELIEREQQLKSGVRLPPAISLRRAAVTIPGTGDAAREGFEHEPKQPEEPNAGKQFDEAPLPGDDGAEDETP